MNERLVLTLLAASLARPLPARADGPNPLTLREAAARAAERAPRVGTARAAAAEGATLVRVASTIFRPEGSVSTTPGYSVGLPIAVAGDVPAFFTAKARWVLYDGAQKGDVLEEVARMKGLDGSLEAARRESVRDALVAYARVSTDEAFVLGARRRLAAQESLQRRTEALEREGRKTSLDAERSALDVARARQSLLDAESDRELDRMDLRRLVGWPDGDAIVLADDPLTALPEPSNADGLIAALSTDPTLRSLDLQIEDLRRSERLKARLQPVVTAAAQYSRLSSATGYANYYLNFKNDAFTAGASISIPVFSDRQAARSAESLARLEHLAAERGERDAELRLAERQLEVAAGRTAVESALARRAEGIAEESLCLARVLAGEGRGEADDVDRREVEAAGAADAAARAGLDLFTARVRLLSLHGELSAR